MSKVSTREKMGARMCVNTETYALLLSLFTLFVMLEVSIFGCV